MSHTKNIHVCQSCIRAIFEAPFYTLKMAETGSSQVTLAGGASIIKVNGKIGR